MDFSALSNDQLAILGCFGALATCGLLVALTYHFGPAGKKSAAPQRAHLPLRTAQAKTQNTESEVRKAA